MKLLIIKIDTSYEVEDALGVFATDNLKALGIESRKRSDFEQAGWLHDSTVVEMDDIKDLPKDTYFYAYFDEEADKDELVEKFQAKLEELKSYGLNTGEGKITTSYIEDQDWNTAWQKYYHVIDFSRHLAIVPEWEDYQPAFSDQQLIKLDPGLAFGTGNHKTTQLAMMGIERAMVKPMSVVDVGTGSGILAIAAAKLGAKTVKAVDIDATAVRVAIENIAGNELTEKISVQQGDLLHGTEGKADIIIANIIADIIIMLLQDIPGKLKSGGIFLASGIIEERQNDVSAAASKVGLCVEAVDAKGGWVVMQMRKED